MTDQNDEKLKPCPFCGTGPSLYSGPTHYRQASELYRGKTDFWIQCPTCGACGPARRADHAEERSAELAVQRWNTRAPDPASEARVLELEKADRHRFGSPPEPVVNPSEAWCDAYANWYYQGRG